MRETICRYNYCIHFQHIDRGQFYALHNIPPIITLARGRELSESIPVEMAAGNNPTAAMSAALQSMQLITLTICQVKKTMMNQLFAAFFLLLVCLISCTKSEPIVSINPGGINDSRSNASQQNNRQYDGQWQWIGTSSGPFNTISLADSPVVLTLNPDSTYEVTLSKQLSFQGTFSTDSSAFWDNIKFNNITEPAGDTTAFTIGNITYLYFNYSQIGRLVIYQNDEMSISGDTLTLLRTPITPETPVSLFKRIGN